MTKNQNLCERPYCRKPWSWFIGAYDSRTKRSWTLRTCDEHAEPYRGSHERRSNITATLTRRTNDA